MSNHLAVATVTETIAQVIRDAVTPLVAGAEVTTDRPDRAAKDAAARVNVFLYQVAPNASQRNSDLPMRGSGGTLATRPRTALDLFYIITFYGRDEQLLAQQLLGLTAATLHLHAHLTRQDVLRAIEAAPGGFLNGSDLAGQTETINLSPYALSLEELSKLWSVMFQVPYALSMSYQCSVVVIDGPPAPAPLPVRGAGAVVGPGARAAPSVRFVGPAVRGSPIVAGSSLVIEGRGLGGAGTTVVIGDVVLTPAAGEVSDARVTVALTDSRLEAGTLSLVVMAGGAASPPAEFVLAPAITGVRVRGGKGGASPALLLTLDPPVWSNAVVTVFLSPTAAAGSPAGGYAFDATPSPPPPAAGQPPAPRRVSAVAVPLPGVGAGRYLVRVRVNGAESPLGTAAQKDGTSRYASPAVRVP